MPHRGLPDRIEAVTNPGTGICDVSVVVTQGGHEEKAYRGEVALVEVEGEGRTAPLLPVDVPFEKSSRLEEWRQKSCDDT